MMGWWCVLEVNIRETIHKSVFVNFQKLTFASFILAKSIMYAVTVKIMILMYN